MYMHVHKYFSDSGRPLAFQLLLNQYMTIKGRKFKSENQSVLIAYWCIKPPNALTFHNQESFPFYFWLSLLPLFKELGIKTNIYCSSKPKGLPHHRRLCLENLRTSKDPWILPKFDERGGELK